MANYINLNEQEVMIRDFIKTYGKYLDRSRLADKQYYRLHGKAYLDSVYNMLDKSGFYIFHNNFDNRTDNKQPRIYLWFGSTNDFYPITALRFEKFKREFEERNNIKRRMYKYTI